MAKRRGKGEGTISKRKDGRFMARVDIGRDPATGRRRRKTVYGATRRIVAKGLSKLLGRAAVGELHTTSTPIVSVWLEDWYRTHKSDWRPGTQHVYRRAIDGWLVPAFGTRRLEALKPYMVQAWANEVTKGGPRRMVTTAHVVLRSALAWAMTMRELTYNAAALVKVPQPVAARKTPLSATQAAALVAVASEHRLGALVAASVTLGLRVGEACGLQWADLDLVSRRLRVRVQVVDGALAPLKTPLSRRALTMPVALVALFKAQKVRQLEERLKAGERWHDAGDFVFTQPDGRILRAAHARKALAALSTRAGVPLVPFHALRHTAATLLLKDGASLFAVSRILGHSEIGTTSDVYGHLVDEMTADAAARMDRILGGTGV